MHNWIPFLFGMALSLLSVALGRAAENSPSLPPDDDPLVRELFVPFEDLDVVLKGGGRRVFLTRPEYDELVRRASVAVESPAPQSSAVLSADYDGKLVGTRAIVRGRLLVDVTSQGIQSVPLALSGVSLLQAELDGQPAALGQPIDGIGQLFVEGIGRHELILEISIPVKVAAAQQTLDFRLPQAAAGSFQLTATGNVDVKSGVAVLGREQVDGNTRFSFLAPDARTQLVLSLSKDHTESRELVLARTVLVDELTETYERLHVTASMHVPHGAVERFRFAIPEGFDITDVKAPRLSRWQVVADEGRMVLEVQLREAVSRTEVLNVTAQRNAPDLTAWSMPILEPLDVAGTVCVVGLLVDEHLETQSLTAQGLIPIDVSALTATLPPSIFEAEPGAPGITPIVAYFSPQSRFQLAADFAKPPAKLVVTTNQILRLSDAGQVLSAEFNLTPLVERTFECNVTMESGWEVSGASHAGRPLPYETYAEPDGRVRTRLRFDQSIEPGTSVSILLEATRTPAGWLGEWESRDLVFPSFVLREATETRGALAVQANDDFVVEAETVAGLLPLDEREMVRHGLGRETSDLAFYFESGPVSGQFLVRRVTPRLTAETYSFLKIEPNQLVAHYEVLFDVSDARTRQLSFALPLDTPEEIEVTGLGDATIKEYHRVEDEALQRWDVTLETVTKGEVGIAVSFERPIDLTAATDPSATKMTIPLPVIQARDVAYQTGAVAIEGSSELECVLSTQERRIDVGELIDANYQPGNRLLGAFGFVGEPATISIQVSKPEQYGLPSAIVERAEMVSGFSNAGVCQSAARYTLVTKTPFVEIELPKGSTLWSAYLDGSPTKPQRNRDRLLISLPRVGGEEKRDLRLTFETPTTSVWMWGELAVAAPALFVRHAPEEAAMAVPVADLQWFVSLPTGFRLADSHGRVHPDHSHQRTQQQVAAYVPTVERLMESRSEAVAMDAAFTSLSHTLTHSQATAESASANADVAQAAQVELDLDAIQGEDSRDLFDAEAAPPAVLQPGGSDVPSDAAVSNGPAQQTVGRDMVADHRQGRGKYWALEGLRSLQIEVAGSPEQLAFQSLGERPRLKLTVVDYYRLELFSWGGAFFVIGIGMWLVSRSTAAKIRYVILVLTTATVLPLALGWHREAARTMDYVFYAGLALLPLYMAISCWRQLRAWGGRRAQANAIAAAMVLTFWTLPNESWAQQETEVQVGPIRVKLLGPDVPVSIPDDVVIVPYNPQVGTTTESSKVIVPYEKYVELWDLAYPDRKLTTRRPPADYAWSGGVWRTTLSDGNSLLLRGKLEIDSFVDSPVAVPLQLAGGVLEQATMDGGAARIAGEPNATASNAGESQNGKPQATAPQRSIVLIDTKGRHTLEVAIRFRLSRQGGWRVVDGALPKVPAAKLVIEIPEADTELRLRGATDRAEIDSERSFELVETAIDQGLLRLQWRPRVAQAAVDQSLTVVSEAVFDVQEDSLRFVYEMNFQFPRAVRDSFVVDVAQEYLLERIIGENVRGWQREGDRVTVTLLNPVRDKQRVILHLSLRGPVGAEHLRDVEVPLIQAPDAVLHEGKIAIRRSPLLNVRAAAIEGLVRTDLQTLASVKSTTSESPLGIKPYQAYRFARTPYRLGLSISRVEAVVDAEVQTLLRVSENRRNIESRVLLTAKDRPIHAITLELPAGFDPKEVIAPDIAQSSMRPGAAGRRLLSIYLNQGQVGTFSVILKGDWKAKTLVPASVDLPRIIAVDAQRHVSTLVVLTSPSLKARAVELAGCEQMLLERAYSWLDAGQRPLARLAVHAESMDYGGRVELTPREPRVRYRTVSNLRVTSRAFEETILLDFTITDAGLREVSFLLPSDLRDSRISAPLLRKRTITDVSADQIRVTLELKDAVMGQFRVLVENDRLVTDDERSVPIPVVETGIADEQFVALESVGRDEVIVAGSNEVEPLGRQQSQWRTLASMLSDDVTQAYLVSNKATAPQLVVQTKDREMLQTVGARIAFAETILVVDENGDYRGTQTYQIDNRTEQFLEIVLPKDATLWTARVASEPVKPIEGNGVIRIPLAKTAEGDQDYPVELKYGGELGALAVFSEVSFPLMKTANINVEESQVRLLLPETFRWFGFDGSMRNVAAREDLIAGYVQYKKEQLMSAASGLASKNPFARARSLSNLKKFVGELESLDSAEYRRGNNARLEQELASSRRALEMAKRQIQEEAEVYAEDQTLYFDNNGRLNRFFEQQSNSRSERAFSSGAANFATPSLAAEDVEAEQRRGGKLQQAWIDSNELSNSASVNQELLNKRIKSANKQATAPQEGGYGGGGYGAGGYGGAGGGYGGGYASDGQASAYGGEHQSSLDDQGGYGDVPGAGRSARTERFGGTDRRDSTRERLQRFQAQLDQKSDSGPFTAFSQDGASPAPAVATMSPADPARFDDASAATGFASLDVAIPVRGNEYMFTTPRGDLRISARSVSQGVVERSLRIALVVVVLVVASIAYRFIRRIGVDQFFGRPVCILLFVLALLLLVFAQEPVLPLLLLAMSVGQFVRLSLPITTKQESTVAKGC